MLKCEKCGKQGSSEEIKKCPTKFSQWASKFLCKDCYMSCKKDSEKIESITCPNCGSRTNKTSKTCEYCKIPIVISELNSVIDKDKKIIINEKKPIKSKTVQKDTICVMQELEQNDISKKSLKKPLSYIAVYMVVLIVCVSFFSIVIQAKDDAPRFYDSWELIRVRGLGTSKSDFGGVQVWTFYSDKTILMEKQSTNTDSFYKSNYFCREGKWKLFEQTLVITHLSNFTDDCKDNPLYSSAVLQFEYSFDLNDKKLTLHLTYLNGKEVTLDFKKLEF